MDSLRADVNSSSNELRKLSLQFNRSFDAATNRHTIVGGNGGSSTGTSPVCELSPSAASSCSPMSTSSSLSNSMSVVNGCIINNNNNNSSINNSNDDDQRRNSPSAHTLVANSALASSARRACSRHEHRRSLADLGYGKAESYTRLQRLGKGTYATVFMGRSRLSNELIALKEINKEHDEGAPCTAIREVSLLRSLRHANIITLHDICHTPTKLTLVFEYVGVDLYTYIRQNNYLLALSNVRLLMFQLLRGLAYCHARHVLHRDLKPQNLLVSSRGELKICDFGLARAKSIPTKSYSNEVVTLWYRPPDVLLGSTNYDASIDMWGVGCVLFEMITGRTLFPGSSIQQQLYLIFSLLGAPNRANWPEALSLPAYQQYKFPAFWPEPLGYRAPRLDADGVRLLTNFLRFKPTERICASKAMRDLFFSRHLPPDVYTLDDRESVLSVNGVKLAQNPGQKLNRM